MSMNRRNVLVGLGTIVAGGGAALGTGAFSSVEADRTVTVDAAGDSSALIALDHNTSFEPYVKDTDGLLEIDLSSSQINSGSGVNLGATTTIGELSEDGSGNLSGVTTHAFTITNNGSQSVDIDVSVSVPSGQNSYSQDEVLNLWGDVPSTDDGEFGSSDSGESFGDLVTDGIVNLASESTIDVVFQIDTSDLDTDDIDTGTALIDGVTITATA